jgi:hypothetical protein
MHSQIQDQSREEEMEKLTARIINIQGSEKITWPSFSKPGEAIDKSKLLEEENKRKLQDSYIC